MKHKKVVILYLFIKNIKFLSKLIILYYSSYLSKYFSLSLTREFSQGYASDLYKVIFFYSGII